MKKYLLGLFFLSTIFSNAQSIQKQGDGHLPLATLDSTRLPIVFINTNFQAIVDEPKIDANMAILDKGYNLMNHVTDVSYKYNGKIGIEQRGSISQQWWWTQKSYGFETRNPLNIDTNVSILGMPKENDWILYGPFNESTLMKNVLTYQLVRELGYWVSRTKYCEVMLKTGFTWKYNGVYVMMEKIKKDKNRVDISKLDFDDNAGDSLTGGYIIAVDQNINASDSGWFSAHPQSANLFLTYKYPKGADITLQQKKYIQAYVDSFENALSSTNFADPINGYRKYMESTTFMDFFFIQEMSKNIDAYKRSSYLTKDRINKGGKLMASPHWDYNSAWEVKVGGCEPFATDTGWTYPLTCWVNASFPVPFWWKRLLQDTVYTRDMKCRWTQLRSTVLSNANIYHIMDSVANYVSVASARHYSQFNLTLNYQTEVNNLKTWIGKRLVWMDANMPGNCWNTSVYEDYSNMNFVQITPNPSSGKVLLNSQNEKIFSVEVFDVFGRKVQQVSSQNEISELNLTKQPAGVYFLQFKFKNGVVTSKMVKN